MLLYTITYPYSFEDLQTYEGRIYLSFQAACLARGLLDSDDEWDTCLNEAELISSSYQLRQLFSIILLNNTPADSLSLFHRYLHDLSNDYRYRL